MQLGRYQVSTLRPPPILSITFSHNGRLFFVAGETGYEVWRTWPLALIRRRALPGTIGKVVPLPNSPLLVLQGGGAAPLYPPNKAIVFHDGAGQAVSELEFGERIRGIATRQSTIVIALSRRVIAFQYTLGDDHQNHKTKGKEKAEVEGGLSLRKIGEWETFLNENGASNKSGSADYADLPGLLALSTKPGATLLAIPGRQAGHVQLVNLPPCPLPPSKAAGPSRSRESMTAFRSPIILAHTHPLATLSCTSDGAYILTTSERGTLLRVWDTVRGRLERELRRGVDPVEMWGAEFEDSMLASPGSGAEQSDKRRGGQVVGWSDKGTIHIWADEDAAPTTGSGASTPAPTSLGNIISRNLPLPKYFSSTTSFAQFPLPRKNPHAFASTISAAAEAARMPSMKIAEEGLENREWAERFVVAWVEVEVDLPPDPSPPVPPTENKGKKVSISGPGMIGAGMGSREERRSFGSDNTSRTSTPTARGPPDTPPHILRRNGSGPDKPGAHARTHSGSSLRKEKKRATPVQGKRKVIERQLVAVTHSGDWYRLRTPPQASVADEEEEGKKGRSSKCELVEYRRFVVGGGGW